MPGSRLPPIDHCPSPMRLVPARGAGVGSERDGSSMRLRLQGRCRSLLVLAGRLSSGGRSAVAQGGLPKGYVPPAPTHPSYGYLTPEELAEIEAQAREQAARAELEAVPEVASPEPVDPEAAAAWVPPPPAEPWVPAPVAQAQADRRAGGRTAARTRTGSATGTGTSTGTSAGTSTRTQARTSTGTRARTSTRARAEAGPARATDPHGAPVGVGVLRALGEQGEQGGVHGRHLAGRERRGLCLGRAALGASNPRTQAPDAGSAAGADAPAECGVHVGRAERRALRVGRVGLDPHGRRVRCRAAAATARDASGEPRGRTGLHVAGPRRPALPMGPSARAVGPAVMPGPAPGSTRMPRGTVW